MANPADPEPPLPCAMGVLGPIPRDELGVVLTHEHLIIDFRARYVGDGTDEVQEPFDPSDRWRLVAEPARHAANLLRTSVDDAIAELDPFVASGGRTVVDVTTRGLGPDRTSLAAVAERTGVNVIAATGIYAHPSHDDWVHRASVDELRAWMIADLEVGDAHGRRAGVIGEIGIDGDAACELKVFEAATGAAVETGAPLSLHVLSGVLPEARPTTLSLIDRYLDEGGTPGRLIVCHQDGSGDDPGYQDDLAGRGVVLEYDTFGFETGFLRDGGFVQLPSDTRRIDEVVGLWDRGWGGQVLLSHDVCYRMMTRGWGGWGLGHLGISLRPRFAAAGIGPDEWTTMTVHTPGRVFAFA